MKRTKYKLKEKISCPCCAHSSDVFVWHGKHAAPPKTGDFTVCLWCATILRIVEGPQLKEADLNDLLLLPEDAIDYLGKLQFHIRVGHLKPKKCKPRLTF